MRTGDKSVRLEKNLGVFSEKEMSRIRDMNVLLVGLGGLGGHIANGLLRLGVGKMTMVDPDTFDMTNLNRQLFSTTKTIGQSKTEVLKTALQDIDPSAELRFHTCPVSELDDNVVRTADIIIDAVDIIATKCYLEKLAFRHGVPLLHGAIGGWYGQMGIIMPGAFILKELYGNNSKGIEKTLGSPTFTPGVLAYMMVAAFATFASGKEEALTNRILLVDLLNHDYRIVLDRNNEK